MILAPSLSGHNGISHGFFTREGGVSEGIYKGLNCGAGSHDNPDHVRDNRAHVAETLGVEPGNLITPYQVHSADVITVSEPFGPEGAPQLDALVSATPGLAVGVLSADCGPLLFADPKNGIVGAAHSGWKGAFHNILGATMDEMERAGAERREIRVVLGPTISQKHYEVGPEFHARFMEMDSAYARFFVPSSRDGHHYFDLPGLIRLRAEQSDCAHYDDLALCTYADEDRFFSYRRTTHRGEDDYGRLLAGIALG